LLGVAARCQELVEADAVLRIQLLLEPSDDRVDFLALDVGTFLDDVLLDQTTFDE